MFWVAGHLLDHADMHVLSVAVAGALEAVPEQQRGHNRHNHELDHNAHFDFYQNKSTIDQKPPWSSDVKYLDKA